MSSTKGIFIIGAKRTPFCQYGGPLRDLPASHVFAAAAKDAIHSTGVDPSLIDETIVGNVNYLSQCDGGKTPRYCGIYSGVPIEKPALGVSKSCGTGLQAIVTGATDILFGTSNIILTGGSDVMSTLPMLVRNVRFGTALGAPYKFEDHIQRGLVDSYSGLTLARVAEELRKKYGITRVEVDEFTRNSHLKWKAAQNSKAFADEITSLTVNIKKKEILVDKDELQVSTELHPVDGNSASPADGAASLLLASESATKDHNLTPLVRISAWSSVGVDPTDGLPAAAAVRKLLFMQGLKVEDVDLFEAHFQINETFGSQVLATAKELEVDLAKVNVNGGALAIGHPVSATGARMATTLLYAMRRSNLKRGIAATSCGEDQGVAIMLESL